MQGGGLSSGWLEWLRNEQFVVGSSEGLEEACFAVLATTRVSGTHDLAT